MADSPSLRTAPAIAVAVGEQLEVDWGDSDSAIGDDECVLLAMCLPLGEL